MNALDYIQTRAKRIEGYETSATEIYRARLLSVSKEDL